VVTFEPAGNRLRLGWGEAARFPSVASVLTTNWCLRLHLAQGRRRRYRKALGAKASQRSQNTWKQCDFFGRSVRTRISNCQPENHQIHCPHLSSHHRSHACMPGTLLCLYCTSQRILVSRGYSPSIPGTSQWATVWRDVRHCGPVSLKRKGLAGNLQSGECWGNHEARCFKLFQNGSYRPATYSAVPGPLNFRLPILIPLSLGSHKPTWTSHRQSHFQIPFQHSLVLRSLMMTDNQTNPSPGQFLSPSQTTRRPGSRLSGLPPLPRSSPGGIRSSSNSSSSLTSSSQRRLLAELDNKSR